MKEGYITYPKGGGTKTLGVGTTRIDFYEGKVILPDGTEDWTSTGLMELKRDWCRSLLIWADQDVVITLDDRGKWTCDANVYTPVVNLEFKCLNIETSVSTKIKVWASTHGRGILTPFEPVTEPKPLKKLDLKASTRTTLLANATYRSDSFKTDGYDKIVGYVHSDVASATDGVVIQQCHDGDFSDETVIVESKFTMSADVELAFSVDIVAKYARIKFVNGPSNQTEFRLYCYLKT